jgi:hypothetical protein
VYRCAPTGLAGANQGHHSGDGGDGSWGGDAGADKAGTKCVGAPDDIGIWKELLDAAVSLNINII